MSQNKHAAKGFATIRKWLLCFFIATALLLASLWLLLALWYRLPHHLFGTWLLLFIVSASLLASIITLYLYFYYSCYRKQKTPLPATTSACFASTVQYNEKHHKKHSIKHSPKREKLIQCFRKLLGTLIAYPLTKTKLTAPEVKEHKLNKHKYKWLKHSKTKAQIKFPSPYSLPNNATDPAFKTLKCSKYAKYGAISYAAIWLTGLGWYLSLTPSQHKAWKQEVQYLPHYQRDADNPNLITIYNVRNFIWQTREHAIPRWQTRQINLSTLTGIDISNTYWMGEKIAHTIVSFRFKESTPLAFSLEIRKEQHESFSTLGGFFRQYELTLVAAEELDIIYTRTNVRGEQVYLFPLSTIKQAEIKALFEAYLQMMDKLHAKPEWYNTLTSNCTTLIYYMARNLIIESQTNLKDTIKPNIIKRHLPWDYRIWASGYLPNYLYDIGLLERKWDIKTWYKNAHVNPKVINFHNTAGEDASNNSSNLKHPNIIPHDTTNQTDNSLENQFSQLIRQGL